MTATLPPSSADPAIIVHGFVTDPKFVGYQLLTNYESTYWRALVGTDSWSLYEVLRSFCHEGRNTCHPSVNLLMDILGLKQRRVLTGWATNVRGKEYQYPGLIEILQENKLLIAEVEGEGPKMRYIFHVNMTPGLLSEEQLSQLPEMLQKKHTALLARCEQAQQELESRRRPPKVKPAPQTSHQPGYDKLSEGYDKLSEGCDNLSYKQHPINNTHKTEPHIHEDHNNNSSEITDAKHAVVVALTDKGIASNVARRLAHRHSHKRITEKIEYLEFLLDEAPEKAQKPCGWLRRAIEENYGPPDGYVSLEERERQTAAAAAQARQEAEEVEARQAAQEQEQAQEQARRRAIDQEYGTTAKDYKFWKEAQREIKFTMPEYLGALVADAEILKVTAENVLVGVRRTDEWRALQHPPTRKTLARSLSYVAGRTVGLEVCKLE